jgi:hypothetical protein
VRKMLVVLTGLGAVVAAGVAVAQAPSPPSPPSPPAEMRTGEHRADEHGWRGMMHGMHRPPMSKAAHFMFRRGDQVMEIKCSDDEPMKACVDAAAVLMDKLAAAPK